MIKDNIQEISSIFLEKLKIPLFNEIPMAEIDSIESKVTDFDSLRLRCVDLCNIFDRINKKQLDRISGLTSQGSKACLINILKKTFSNNHDSINAIELHLDYIFLFRDYLTHKKNKNIQKACDYLEVNLKEDDPGIIWNKIKSLFDTTLITLNSLFYTPSDSIKQNDIDEKVSNNILKMFGEKYCRWLDEPRDKAFFAYLLSNKTVIDIEMAKIFNISVDDLRDELLGYYPIFIHISYCSRHSTIMSVKECWRTYLSQYIAGEIKYEN